MEIHTEIIKKIGVIAEENRDRTGNITLLEELVLAQYMIHIFYSANTGFIQCCVTQWVWPAESAELQSWAASLLIYS